MVANYETGFELRFLNRKRRKKKIHDVISLQNRIAAFTLLKSKIGEN